MATGKKVRQEDATTLKLREKIRTKGFLNFARELLQFLVDRLFEIRLSDTASTMTLATLLGIVPLLAISLAIFAAFPAFSNEREALETLILTSFIPEQYSEVIIEHLREFSQHAAGLTTFGAVGLVITGVLLINKLFVTINRIFRIRRPRPLTERILIYWALITLGPISIATSLSFTGHVAALTFEGVDPGISRFFYSVGLIILQSFAYAAVYTFVPNCFVRFRHAFIGGFVVSLASLVVKRGFAHYVAAGTITSLYGAFAAVPVFVLWIYVAWYLFFAGAAMTAVIPQLIGGRCTDHFKPGNAFYTALAFLEAFLRREAKGETPVLTTVELSEVTDTTPQDARAVLEVLSEIDFVKPVSEKGAPESWALVADTARVTVRPVLEALALDSKNLLLTNEKSAVAAFNEKSLEVSTLNLPLREVLRVEESA